jgi:spermidine synthase
VVGLQATAVEIDERVIEACRTHFALPPDGDGLQVVHADAADYVAACRGGVDVLQVDAYDSAVDRPALDGEAFYANCCGCLREGGTVAVNLVGGAVNVRASVADLRRGLQPRAVWQFPPTEAGNVVVIAHRGEVPGEDALLERADLIEDRWDLPARSWLAMARRSA